MKFSVLPSPYTTDKFCLTIETYKHYTLPLNVQEAQLLIKTLSDGIALVDTVGSIPNKD
jgi:hypothetical protein